MQKVPVHFAKPYLLLSLIVLIVGAIFVYVRILPPTIIVVNRSDTQFHRAVHLKESMPVQKLFIFDPNTIDSAGLDSLRLPRWIKQNLLKYRRSGAFFYKQSDLRKLYGMSDSLYDQVKDFILIVPPNPKKDFTSPSKSTVLKNTHTSIHREKIDLNSPIAASLSIPHLVGEKRCLSIIKYREKLGGFYSVSQLAEVYTIGDSLYPLISKYYFADPASIAKRNISEETWRSLVSHPYIDTYLAKHILQARKISPELLSIHQLFDAKVIDSAAYSSLQYYFN